MAEDKKRDGEAKAEEGQKKSGLPPLILIGIGAILGGAGVSFLVPPKRVEVPVQQKAPEFVHIQHPDIVEHQLNPRTQAGKAYLSVGFYFVYRVREDREREAFEQIKANWDRARSNVLLLLKARTMAELNAENGQRVLAKDLVDELDAVLFPGKRGEKVAQVTEILWSKWVVQ